MGEVVTFFDGGEVISMADVQAYQGVLQDAFAVHKDREAIRHGLWKEYPATDQIFQIKVKVDRIARSLEQLPKDGPAGDRFTEDLKANAISELHDIINYSIFAVRLLDGTA